MTPEERFERLKSSHVRLMTEHEVLAAEYEKAYAAHLEWLKAYDARCEQDRLDRKDLDRRIADLVSGIG